MLSLFRKRNLVVLCVTLALLLALPGTLLAHEHRELGDYELVVGWAVEPAFAGEKNGIDFRVMNLTTEEPVEGLEETLQAEITFGGTTRQLELRPVFQQPGRYTADIVPTREGDYRFRFFGTIEGVTIDETFDSADGKFSGVKGIETVQFPEPVPAADAIHQVAQDASSQALVAQDVASTSQTLALAGIVTGVVGILLGLVALLSRGRRTEMAGPTAPRLDEEARL